MAKLLIYGANGFTGRQIVAKAVACGLTPIVAGRDPAASGALGRLYRLPHRSFALDDALALDRGLAGVEVVLHCAGPFRHTAAPMLDACLRNGIHYLDIVGEYDVMETVAARDVEIRAAGVMAMCAIGGDVVPTDCLAAHMKRRMPQTRRLVLYMRGLERPSGGTAETFVQFLGTPNVVRRDGRLQATPHDTVCVERFGGRDYRMIGLPWGDIVTAWHTTGIPDIEVYMSLWPGAVPAIRLARRFPVLFQSRVAQDFLKRQAHRWITGPAEDVRNALTIEIIAEAVDIGGQRIRSNLVIKEAYSFTAESAAEIARRVLAGDWQPGFQTPAGHFGPDFVLDIPGSVRTD